MTTQIASTLEVLLRAGRHPETATTNPAACPGHHYEQGQAYRHHWRSWLQDLFD